MLLCRAWELKLKTEVTEDSDPKTEDSDDQFKTLWRKLDLGSRYKLIQMLPKGGDIHNHLAGSGDPVDCLKFGADTSLTQGEKFFTRFRISGDSSPDSVLWETISECNRNSLARTE